MVDRGKMQEHARKRASLTVSVHCVGLRGHPQIFSILRPSSCSSQEAVHLKPLVVLRHKKR